MSKKPRKKDEIPRLHIRKGATRREIYDKAKKAFTADDLLKFIDIGPQVPAGQLLAELEAIHRDEKAKKRKKK